ncbi:hypothetical protein EVAR_30355_1 [Eumeta japonica]|uniref:Uncharacterized protein n=1 Tax=Eumeta variegata TaxID=151549 RepID=A0A4C2A8I1_EUMVA|nr:hypothetical protein EVAR_30355_1 [Eumeta japonica]
MREDACSNVPEPVIPKRRRGGDASSYQPVLPFRIEEQQFEELVKVESAQAALVRACYRRHRQGHYLLDGDDKWSLYGSVQSPRDCQLPDKLSSSYRATSAAVHELSKGRRGGGRAAQRRTESKAWAASTPEIPHLTKYEREVTAFAVKFRSVNVSSSSPLSALPFDIVFTPKRPGNIPVTTLELREPMGGKDHLLADYCVLNISKRPQSTMWEINAHSSTLRCNSAHHQLVSDSRNFGYIYIMLVINHRAGDFGPLRLVVVRFSNLVERDEQRQRLSEVQKAFNSCALNALSEGCDVGDLLRSPVEIQCELALELLSEGAHPKGVVAVFRDATVPDSQSQLMKLAYNRLKNLRKKIEDAVPPENIITLQSSSTDSSRTDPPSESEERLAPFRERVLAALSAPGRKPQHRTRPGEGQKKDCTGYITCSEFGLTELELLELLMPTSNSEAVISLEDANFNFSTLCVAKNMMGLASTAGKRGVRPDDVALAGGSGRARAPPYVRVQSAPGRAPTSPPCISPTSADADDTDTEEAQELGCADDDDALLDSTPFHSGARTAAAFTQRHVEEAWLHLLLAGDFAKLKDLTVCNFDFLLAAVQTVTISYLRCILEHVRCYILDRDVELVYGAVRKASDILTRDPMQLGAQIATPAHAPGIFIKQIDTKLRDASRPCAAGLRADLEAMADYDFEMIQIKI